MFRVYNVLNLVLFVLEMHMISIIVYVIRDSTKLIRARHASLDIANTYSTAGSYPITDCQCNAGFTGPDGGACTQCAIGKIKVASGTGSCIDCDIAGQTSVSPFTSCVDCAAGKYESGRVCFDCPAETPLSPVGSTSVDACYMCVAGKVYDNALSSCVNCAAGKYTQEALEFDVSGWCTTNPPTDINLNGHYVHDGYCYDDATP